MPKKPTKKQLRDAGKKLGNPRTPEKKERKAAQTLRQGRKKEQATPYAARKSRPFGYQDRR